MHLLMAPHPADGSRTDGSTFDLCCLAYVQDPAKLYADRVTDLEGQVAKLMEDKRNGPQLAEDLARFRSKTMVLQEQLNVCMDDLAKSRAQEEAARSEAESAKAELRKAQDRLIILAAEASRPQEPEMVTGQSPPGMIKRSSSFFGIAGGGGGSKASSSSPKGSEERRGFKELLEQVSLLQSQKKELEARVTILERGEADELRMAREQYLFDLEIELNDVKRVSTRHFSGAVRSCGGEG